MSRQLCNVRKNFSDKVETCTQPARHRGPHVFETKEEKKPNLDPFVESSTGGEYPNPEAAKEARHILALALANKWGSSEYGSNLGPVIAACATLIAQELRRIDNHAPWWGRGV